MSSRPERGTLRRRLRRPVIVRQRRRVHSGITRLTRPGAPGQASSVALAFVSRLVVGRLGGSPFGSTSRKAPREAVTFMTKDTFMTKPSSDNQKGLSPGPAAGGHGGRRRVPKPAPRAKLETALVSGPEAPTVPQTSPALLAELAWGGWGPQSWPWRLSWPWLTPPQKQPVPPGSRSPRSTGSCAARAFGRWSATCWPRGRR